jgi:23S rRNA (cytosine1962-C5)-methyltransferase
MSSLRELLEHSLAQRKAYLHQNNIEGYCLNPEPRPGLPARVDIYKDNAVVHLFATTVGDLFDMAPSDFIQRLELELRSLLNIRSFFYKDRTGKGAGAPIPSKEHKEITVREYGHAFSINLSDYLDTGLFLDHRETRRWIESKSKGKVVLNTFAYTGSFSVYAAAGGAQKTYSVDLSGTYCEWIKKNLELNGLPPEKNWVFKMDTLEFFHYAKKKNLSFDIIIIDPPTFSKNKGRTFSVERDYPQLINEALELLNKGGFILFSNNCQGFRLNPQKISRCRIKEHILIPKDFEGTHPHHCFLISPL